MLAGRAGDESGKVYSFNPCAGEQRAYICLFVLPALDAAFAIDT